MEEKSFRGKWNGFDGPPQRGVLPETQDEACSLILDGKEGVITPSEALEALRKGLTLIYQDKSRKAFQKALLEMSKKGFGSSQE